MTLARTLDDLLHAATTRGDIPGIAAVVTDRDETLYEAGFGTREAGSGIPMTPDSVFWIASMTKAVTGVAAMQLVERGKLSLDAPVGDVIPEIAAVKVLDGFDAAGQPILRPPASAVTLRQLLTHTAGFGYDTWDPMIRRYVQTVDIPSRATGLKAALDLPLVFDPGCRWQYGINIDWVGLTIETVTGQALGAYFAEKIFAPLGMNSTGFRITGDMATRLATLHQRETDGLRPRPEFRMVQDPEVEAGGGGLYATMPDYARFMRMILNKGKGNGNRLLEADTVEQMSVNQIADCRVTTLKSCDPPRSRDAEFFPGIDKTWGLTFMINETRGPTGRSAGSLAWAGLANSYFWIDPATGIAGSWATQILPFADHVALPLFLDFETAVYQTLGSTPSDTED